MWFYARHYVCSSKCMLRCIYFTSIFFHLIFIDFYPLVRRVPAKQIDIWYIATIVSRCWPIFHFIGKHLLLLLFKWILFDMWLLQKDFQIYRHSFGHGSQTYVDKFSSSRQAYAKAHTTSLWPQLTISSNIRKICWSDRL